MESLYDTLGVDRDADAAQLRRGYRQAVKNAHPDTGGSAEAFAAVQAAWHTLSDPERRGRYDDLNQPPSAEAVPQTKARASGPRSAPATGQPPRAEPDSQPSGEAATPAGTRRATWITTGLILISVVTGTLTWLIIADIGSLFAVLGSAYLVAIVWCLVTSRHGSDQMSRYLARLLRAAWILAAAITMLSLLTWATTGRTPAPALIWTAIVLTFAAATTALSRGPRRPAGTSQDSLPDI